MSGEIMQFPENIEEFIDRYSFKDKDEIYTNGSDLIPVFRVEQAIEHYMSDISNANDLNVTKKVILKLLKKSDKRENVYPKKLFISLGMSDVDENVVINKIGYVIEMVSIKYDYPIECIHNYDTVGPKDVGRLWYLGEAIKKLDGCDTIYMCNGWEHHNGCIIEYIIAKLYGLNIIYEN